MAGEKKAWQDPIVLAAIVTSLGGLAITIVTVRGANNDLKDSFKATAEAINSLNLKIGELDGKINAHIAWHQTAAMASPHKPSVMTIGTIEVHGHGGSSSSGGQVASYKPDSGTSLTAALAAKPETFVAPAPPAPAMSVISTDLDSALKFERAK
jgi:hypothetical protein